MKLTILPLSQRDLRWKDKKLGGGGSIGLYGCYLTCLSMYLIYCGKEDMTPDVLNEVFKVNKCYDGNNLNFYAIGKIWGDFKSIEFYECNDIPCDTSKVDTLLKKKQPVIAKVDFDNNPSTKGDSHFVLIIGKTDDGHYIINDPWEGETYFFDAKYGEPSKGIYGLRIYEGIPKETASFEDKINDLTDKLTSCNTALSEKSAETARLVEDLATQERDNKDLIDQLNKARSERDTATWEKEQANVKVKTLSEEVVSLKKGIGDREDEIKALKIDLATSQTTLLEDIPSLTFVSILIKRLFNKRR